MIKGVRAQNGPMGSIVLLQHHRDLKGLKMVGVLPCEASHKFSEVDLLLILLPETDDGNLFIAVII